MEIKLSKELGDLLLNIENPLLIAYKEKAPGSFKHSEEVAAVCDKIGRELKLDTNVLRILSLYHDIGKMWYPEYYCENQPKNSNIHDSLDPIISAHYIISHVANSIAILTTQVPNIPIEIVRCISMHHGNRLLKSIYNKLNDEEKQQYDITKFKYPYNAPDNIYAIVPDGSQQSITTGKCIPDVPVGHLSGVPGAPIPVCLSEILCKWFGNCETVSDVDCTLPEVLTDIRWL